MNSELSKSNIRHIEKTLICIAAKTADSTSAVQRINELSSHINQALIKLQREIEEFFIEIGIPDEESKEKISHIRTKNHPSWVVFSKLFFCFFGSNSPPLAADL